MVAANNETTMASSDLGNLSIFRLSMSLSHWIDTQFVPSTLLFLIVTLPALLFWFGMLASYIGFIGAMVTGIYCKHCSEQKDQASEAYSRVAEHDRS